MEKENTLLRASETVVTNCLLSTVSTPQQRANREESDSLGTQIVSSSPVVTSSIHLQVSLDYCGVTLKRLTAARFSISRSA